MTTKSGFFQVCFSVALAIALIVQASPARAETVTLVCQNQSGSYGMADSFTLRVDYDRKIVDMPNSADMSNPVGTAYCSAAATITESDVRWGSETSDLSKERAFMGRLNRLSGQGYATYGDGRLSHHMSGPCRRATQKF